MKPEAIFTLFGQQAFLGLIEVNEIGKEKQKQFLEACSNYCEKIGRPLNRTEVHEVAYKIDL